MIATLLFLLFAVYVSAGTMTMGMYEDASCTQLKPLSQCPGWTANPFTVNFGECKNQIDAYGMKVGIEPTGDCSSVFKANFYPKGCGSSSIETSYFNGKCFGANGFYTKNSCN